MKRLLGEPLPPARRILLLSALMWLPACRAPTRTTHPAIDPRELSDAVFVHYLASVPVVTVDEGFRAVVLLLRDTGPLPNFEERRDELVRRGCLRKEWAFTADQRLDKGTLAYMLRRICRLDPSLNEWLASPTGLGSRRYALKTCIRAGLIPYGQTMDPVTGGELLSAITAAEERMARDPWREREGV